MDAFTDFVRSCKRFSDPIKDVLIEEILYGDEIILNGVN